MPWGPGLQEEEGSKLGAAPFLVKLELELWEAMAADFEEAEKDRKYVCLIYVCTYIYIRIRI